MKHLNIHDYGTFLGIESQRLVVKREQEKRYYPLNRLQTLTIAKKGVSFSSDLIQALSSRGIRLFFCDFKGTPYAQLIPANHHGVVGARVNQIQFCSIYENSVALAYLVIKGKIANQRATLLYYSKYKANIEHSQKLKDTAEKMQDVIKNMKATDLGTILGYEGVAAAMYFEGLKKTVLSSTRFLTREGRNSQNLINQMLNYGYGILQNQVMNQIFNAGLEPYLGFLHQSRAGRPALVLDIMEEYRAWVVDRAVIKLRFQAGKEETMSLALRKALVAQVMDNLHTRHVYHGKRLELNYIMQRQVYRMSGHFAGNKNYKAFLFKW